jgi:lysozyme
MPDKPSKPTYDVPRLINQVIKHESIAEWDEDIQRYVPYRDSLGVLTIGVGRNLYGRGLSKMECMYLLNNDLIDSEKDLDKALPFWRTLTPLRQLVLVEMMFNLGLGRFNTFHNMKAAIKAGNYSNAADEMLKSKWAKQVGDKAAEMADQMRRGQ